MATDKIFPAIQDLWRGALLNTIAHAIWIAADPLLAYEVGWNGKNYLRQDSMGTSSAIHFADSSTVVGTFFASGSIYNPFSNPDYVYDIELFFRGIPRELRVIANVETLSFMQQEHKGVVQPIITAAFWGSDRNLTAAMPWDKIWENGAHILEIELMPLESVFETLEADLEITAEQLDLIKALFRKRGMELDSTIILDDGEYRALISHGNAGIAETERLLSAINIRLP